MAALTLAASAALAAAPAEDGAWRPVRHTDKMTGATKASLVIQQTADDGHRVEISANCATLGTVRVITLTFLLGGSNARFQIDDQTNVQGSDWVGYSTSTRHRTPARIRFDAGDPISVYPDVDFANQVTLLFPDMDSVHKHIAEPLDEKSASDAVGGLGDLVALMAGSADVAQLRQANSLAVQFNLDGGATPYLETRLSSPFKTYVDNCLGVTETPPPAPEVSPSLSSDPATGDQPVELSESVVRGVYVDPETTQKLVFVDGYVQTYMNGKPKENMPYTFVGRKILLTMPNNKTFGLYLNGRGELIPTDPAYGTKPIARRVN